MDNDDAVIGSIWTRRQAMKMGLGALIGGGMAASFLGCAESTFKIGPVARSIPTTRPLIVSPAMTEGPFFVDEKLNRSNLLAGTTRPAVVNGFPLEMDLSVLCLDSAGNAKPLTGAQVDVWHSDTLGIYSDEDAPMNAEVTSGQRWLRGYQIADAAGAVRFSTIVPGWYEGRTPHIHFKIRQFSASNKQTAEFTSQFFFDDATLDGIYARKPYRDRGQRNMLNTDDGIYGEKLKDGSLAGSHQLLPLTAATGNSFKTQFAIVLSDASLHDPDSRNHGGPGGPGGPPPFGGPPPGGPGGGPPDDGFGPPNW